MDPIDVLLTILPLLAAFASAVISAYYVSGHKVRHLDRALAVFFMTLGLAFFWLFFTDVASLTGISQAATRIPRDLVFRGSSFSIVAGLLIRIIMNGERT